MTPNKRLYCSVQKIAVADARALARAAGLSPHRRFEPDMKMTSRSSSSSADAPGGGPFVGRALLATRRGAAVTLSLSLPVAWHEAAVA